MRQPSRPRAWMVGVVTALAFLSACTPAPAAGTNPATVLPSAPPSTSPDPCAGGCDPATQALADALPRTESGVSHPRCENASRGWLAREVVRPGTFNAADLRVRASGRASLGYLDRDYAVCGESVALHLSAPRPARATVEAIRLGAYGTHQGRVVGRFGPFALKPGRTLPTAPQTTQNNDWPVVMSLKPDATWPPGPYVLRIVTNGQPSSATYVPFYVLSHGEPSPYLVISSDLTHLAYNFAGGSSLYKGPGATSKERAQNIARIATTTRPFDLSGLNQWSVKDVPLATFLDRHGITVDWTTDTSFDADPDQVLRHATVILPGHSEYWTRRGYDALELAVGAGTNLAVLGANELYWQARITRDSHGNLATMSVYRSVAADPVTSPADKTVQWRDAPLNRDPAHLTGLGMTGVGIAGPGSVVSAPEWLFKGSGVKVGTRLPWLYGNEGDGPEPPGQNSPKNLEVLIRGELRNQYGAYVVVGTGYYTASSGAGVFHAGTTEWLCAIDNVCPGQPRPAITRQAVEGITANVLREFRTPRAGQAHPSVATPWMTPTRKS